MKAKPIDMQCITRQSYIAKQAVCTAVVMALYLLSGAALAFGLVPPLLAGELPAWRMCLSTGMTAMSAALWRTGQWIERCAL